jgi:succinate dehydrogenase / fumarate reductase, cytochrome b subunit
MASTPTVERRPLAGAAHWFDVRKRSAGTFAFVLNRITGLGLTVYLFLHLIVLSTLSRGPEAYDQFLALVKSPVFIFFEFLVVVAAIFHGLNGLRIALNSFGIAVPFQKHIFYAVLILTGVICAYFAIRMFSH